MHPILGRLERLAIYIGVWVVIGALLSGVSTRLGLPWVEALALFVPLSVVYAFACLSAWYVCRAAPLSGGSLSRVFASSAVASLVSGALWLVIANAWIATLVLVPALSHSGDRYALQLPFIFEAGVLLFLVAIAAHYTLIAVEAEREADRNRLEFSVATRDAELRALRAQVDPHFLYNSLNSISALTTADPAGARRMCLLLADFLRKTLDVSHRDRITLGEELALVEMFLAIEQVRFGDRLRLERKIDAAALRCDVPPLILQPLVENAITHGVARLLDGGVIRLEALPRDGRLSMAIENPRDEEEPLSGRRGLGLDNVRQRLAMMFGKEAVLGTRTDGAVFRVELEMPWSAHD